MNLELRKWTMADMNSLIEISNAVDRTYLSDRLPKPYTQADAIWWLNMVEEHDGKDGIFRAIVVDGKIAGNISIEQKGDVYHRDAELGYLLDSAYWSKGIMTRAAIEICEIAFEELDLLRITGLVYEPNVASWRVMEKAGFNLEGTMKNAVEKNGHVYDLLVYGRLRPVEEEPLHIDPTKPYGSRENPIVVGMPDCSDVLVYDKSRDKWLLTDGLGNGWIR